MALEKSQADCTQGTIIKPTPSPSSPGLFLPLPLSLSLARKGVYASAAVGSLIKFSVP